MEMIRVVRAKGAMIITKNTETFIVCRLVDETIV